MCVRLCMYVCVSLCIPVYVATSISMYVTCVCVSENAKVRVNANKHMTMRVVEPTYSYLHITMMCVYLCTDMQSHTRHGNYVCVDVRISLCTYANVCVCICV